MNNYKEQFIRIYNEHIKRDGADKLLAYLEKTDFFKAPASTRFHEPYDGGLVEHSVKVFYQLIDDKDVNTGSGAYSEETIAIVALLHDLCKVNYYTTEMRNKKIDGKWQQVPFYTVDDKLPLGHGEKSLMLVSSMMQLTRDEMMAIRWHMGAYVGQQDWNTLSKAYEMHPLSLLLHVADMKATYLK